MSMPTAIPPMNRPTTSIVISAAPACRALPKMEIAEPKAIVRLRPILLANNILKIVPRTAPPWNAETMAPTILSLGLLKYVSNSGTAMVEVMIPESKPLFSSVFAPYSIHSGSSHTEEETPNSEEGRRREGSVLPHVCCCSSMRREPGDADLVRFLGCRWVSIKYSSTTNLGHAMPRFPCTWQAFDSPEGESLVVVVARHQEVLRWLFTRMRGLDNYRRWSTVGEDTRRIDPRQF